MLYIFWSLLSHFFVSLKSQRTWLLRFTILFHLAISKGRNLFRIPLFCLSFLLNARKQKLFGAFFAVFCLQTYSPAIVSSIGVLASKRQLWQKLIFFRFIYSLAHRWHEYKWTCLFSNDGCSMSVLFLLFRNKTSAKHSIDLYVTTRYSVSAQFRSVTTDSVFFLPFFLLTPTHPLISVFVFLVSLFHVIIMCFLRWNRKSEIPRSCRVRDKWAFNKLPFFNEEKNAFNFCF